MKKFLVLVCVVAMSSSLFARGRVYSAYKQSPVNVSTCVYVGGMWGTTWDDENYNVLTSCSGNKFIVTVYPRTEQPWNYVCKITVNDFNIPTKKESKKQQKKDIWFEYPCTVEFFYNVDYPSMEECFANYGGFMVNAKDQAEKRNVSGVLKFNSHFFTAGNEKDKSLFFGLIDLNKPGKMDMGLNLWVDEVGYAISFQDRLAF